MPWEKRFDVDAALEQAMQVYWRHGFDATSMQALLDAMGINRASAYDTFGDKRNLFLAALRRYDAHRERHLAALEARYPPREAIAALFEGWLEQSLGDAGRRGCFLTNTALELAAHDADIGALVAESQKHTEEFFYRLCRAGQARGEIPARLDARRSARALLAALLGLLVLARSRPERALLRSVAASALDALG